MIAVSTIVQESRGEPMAVSVSLINMKGGVGKTTLAAQLAFAAARRDLRTLAVDLDPQANLSQALLSPEKYVKHLRDKKRSEEHTSELQSLTNLVCRHRLEK